MLAGRSELLGLKKRGATDERVLRRAALPIDDFGPIPIDAA